MHELQPVPAKSKLEAVVDRLVDFISSNRYSAGDRLPSERELMDALGVGRSSVREAVRKLEALNALEIRHGAGTFVRRTIQPGEILVPLAIGEERGALLLALDLRRALESEAAALAAVRGSDADIANIEEKLLAMEAVHQAKGAALEEDEAFHRSIYEAAQNPLFEQIISNMRGPFLKFFSNAVKSTRIGESSFPLHRELYQAIADRDPERSRAKTVELLDLVEQDLRMMD
ncbi:FadR/GntR family transcriptional regulator [Roseibium sp.]|uniref:FadR/GntR family transcriptional regulator n=1 Tax=Roseibium sp. TaxID=1936156 RepID=UPI003BB183DD